MKIGIIASLVLSSVMAFREGELMSDNEYKFMRYITQFGKSYGTVAEYKFRLAIYEKRIAQHKEHNEQEGATSS